MKLTLPLIFALFMAISRGAVCTNEPYLAETKVQNDLENMLSRIIPREQFLVQVSSQVGMRSERRLIEGETTSEVPVEKNDPVIHAMPGFSPEAPEEPAPKKPQQQRQIYRMVEVPELRSLRVQVSFDDALAPATASRGKMLVQSYMAANYPDLGSAFFNQMPMLKPPKPVEPKEVPKESEKKKKEEEPTWEEKLWNDKAFLLAAVALIAVYMMTRRKPAPEPAVAAPRRRSSPPKFPELPPPPFYQRFPGFGDSMAESRQPPARPSRTVSDDDSLSDRKRLLDRFFSRSEVFRHYYRTLPRELRDELYAVLKGPAFDSFLDGMELPRPSGDAIEPPDADEFIAMREKEFEELIHAKDWQNRQFFGFLTQLSNEQILSLMSHESPIAACLMLRYLKADQSASILDALPEPKRVDILSAVSLLERTSFSQIATIEKELRTVVQAMPNHIFGSKKDDIEYWGAVLSESQAQEALLHDLEVTQPGIVKDLKKFKFSLEDASSLPDSLLDRVLSSVDNEELALALATCRADVVDVFLDAVSPKRRDLLRHNIVSAKNAPKDQTRAARQNLSRKFREVMT